LIQQEKRAFDIPYHLFGNATSCTKSWNISTYFTEFTDIDK